MPLDVHCAFGIVYKSCAPDHYQVEVPKHKKKTCGLADMN